MLSTQMLLPHPEWYNVENRITNLNCTAELAKKKIFWESRIQIVATRHKGMFDGPGGGLEHSQ